jgi:hypothetical protein
MGTILDFEDLGRRMKTHPANAERCYRAWEVSRASMHPATLPPKLGSKRLSAYENRRYHFQRLTMLDNAVVRSWCRLLALYEDEICPGGEYRTDGFEYPERESEPASTRDRAASDGAEDDDLDQGDLDEDDLDDDETGQPEAE